MNRFASEFSVWIRMNLPFLTSIQFSTAVDSFSLFSRQAATTPWRIAWCKSAKCMWGLPARPSWTLLWKLFSRPSPRRRFPWTIPRSLSRLLPVTLRHFDRMLLVRFVPCSRQCQIFQPFLRFRTKVQRRNAGLEEPKPNCAGRHTVERFVSWTSHGEGKNAYNFSVSFWVELLQAAKHSRSEQTSETPLDNTVRKWRKVCSTASFLSRDFFGLIDAMFQWRCVLRSQWISKIVCSI